ncbi:MAG: hypothetical protein QW698_07580 [Nitrososphaerales archaeon]
MVVLWFRCGINVWHLDCLVGGEINLKEEKAIMRDHDFIASITKKDEGLELFIPPSYTKIFKSILELNNYLEAIGLEEINLSE